MSKPSATARPPKASTDDDDPLVLRTRHSRFPDTEPRYRSEPIGSGDVPAQAGAKMNSSAKMVLAPNSVDLSKRAVDQLRLIYWCFGARYREQIERI